MHWNTGNQKKLVMDKSDYIFGTRAVMEAVREGRPIEKVLIKQGLNNELFSSLYQLIKDNNVPFQFVPVERLNRITRKNHQGVIALISAVEFENIEHLLPAIYEKGVDPFILVLDSITDVRNFGAIVRTAECGGVDTIIVPEKGMARIGADAVKTSAGALHHIPLCKSANLPDTLTYLKESGIKIVAATEKADSDYTASKMDVPLCIVMGSEDRGISGSVLDIADELVRIPLKGSIESLNVSVAAGVIIFEAVRQRDQL
jgi:23S rRNA (guanosine2251-2'-O)-methyltransferase